MSSLCVSNLILVQRHHLYRSNLAPTILSPPFLLTLLDSSLDGHFVLVTQVVSVFKRVDRTLPGRQCLGTK